MTQQPDIIPEGLPDHLPEGEKLIWQGKPNWQRLAINAFHVRKVAAYFVLVIVAQSAIKLSNGAPWTEAFQDVPVITGLGIAACAILVALAYASAKTTSYTLTSKRALMRVGIALPVIINVPFKQIDGASFANTGKGFGTICLKTGGSVRLAYLMLWPHARPWIFTKPQPAFRDIPNVDAVASRLAFALGGQMPVEHTRQSGLNHHMVPAE